MRQASRGGQGSPRAEHVVEGLPPLQVLHREVGHAGDLALLVDADDVRMIEGVADLRLAQEPHEELAVVEEVRERALQGHDIVAALGQEHRGHSPLAELLAQRVVAEPLARTAREGRQRRSAGTRGHAARSGGAGSRGCGRVDDGGAQRVRAARRLRPIRRHGRLGADRGPRVPFPQAPPDQDPEAHHARDQQCGQERREPRGLGKEGHADLGGPRGGDRDPLRDLGVAVIREPHPMRPGGDTGLHQAAGGGIGLADGLVVQIDRGTGRIREHHEGRRLEEPGRHRHLRSARGRLGVEASRLSNELARDDLHGEGLVGQPFLPQRDLVGSRRDFDPQGCRAHQVVTEEDRGAGGIAAQLQNTRLARRRGGRRRGLTADRHHPHGGQGQQRAEQGRRT